MENCIRQPKGEENAERKKTKTVSTANGSGRRCLQFHLLPSAVVSRPLSPSRSLRAPLFLVRPFVRAACVFVGAMSPRALVHVSERTLRRSTVSMDSYKSGSAVRSCRIALYYIKFARCSGSTIPFRFGFAFCAWFRRCVGPAFPASIVG